MEEIFKTKANLIHEKLYEKGIKAMLEITPNDTCAKFTFLFPTKKVYVLKQEIIDKSTDFLTEELIEYWKK